MQVNFKIEERAASALEVNPLRHRCHRRTAGVDLQRVAVAQLTRDEDRGHYLVQRLAPTFSLLRLERLEVTREGRVRLGLAQGCANQNQRRCNKTLMSHEPII